MKLTPMAVLDQAANRIAAHTIATEKSLIDGSRRQRKLIYWRGIVGFVAGIGVLFLYQWAGGGVVQTLCGAVMGGYVGASAFSGMRRAFSYRNGWVDGRQTVLDAVPLLMRGGMDPDQWMRAHMARDLEAYGFTPQQVFTAFDEIERRLDEHDDGNER